MIEVFKTADIEAGWNVMEKTIYLDRTLPLRKRRYLLTHEVMHAVVDWQAEILDTVHAEVK